MAAATPIPVKVEYSKMHPEFYICRDFRIDAGHRVYGHEGKCKNLHGHSYTFKLYVSPKEDLDNLGRVIDFSVLQAKVGSWIDNNWDHGMILMTTDPISCEFLPGGKMENNKIFFLPYNPTAENLAKYLCGVSVELLKEYPIHVEYVVCEETPKCKAQYFNQED